MARSAGHTGIFPLFSAGNKQDTVSPSQELYNGRVWRNTYTGIRNDPFLFSKDFIPGSVIINGRTFNNVKLLYEIFKDEILTLTGRNIIIQLNKEMINRFTLRYANRDYLFVKAEVGDKSLPEGYSNALYEGRTGVYVKYRKVIDPRSVEGKYDAFREVHRIYVIRDSIPVPVKGKGQFLSLFGKDEARILKDYIRQEKLRISGKDPDSFVPVAEYYDRMNR